MYTKLKSHSEKLFQKIDLIYSNYDNFVAVVEISVYLYIRILDKNQ